MFQSKKILVVDDESSLVNLCLIILAEAGFAVRGALSGNQALQMIHEEVPDLVLLDVMMPGMNGIDVCRQIRTDHGSPLPCIVMYTADERETTREHSLRAGADALITKETPIFELPAEINRYLAA